MMSVFEELRNRGLIAQMTHPEEIQKLLEHEKVTFYIGFDPTADSLHVGHFLQMVVMAHMQRAGHTPIALMGGGTAMVGDPSGRTDMRAMLTEETIRHNVACFKKQFERFMDFSDGKAVMVNNADWLMRLEYIPFLRDVGVHFSVNRMLTFDCFKSRLEKGLSFIEFNYMLMQSYDFLMLNEKYNCALELGGDDQWSNIIGGIELVRRARGKEVYGMTFTLLTTSDGKKMGKTQKGAVWLDPEKTPPYDFYQYWRNVDDADVIRCLKMLTFVPLEEIAALETRKGSELNEVKRLLAYEVTKLVHGEQSAAEVQDAAQDVFSRGVSSANMPSTPIDAERLKNGVDLLDLMLEARLIPSRGEGRRLIQQGGVSVNGVRAEDCNLVIDASYFENGEMILKKGKKVYHKITI
ncbi:MAG: tyrosine--tRNA ligase [Clostridiales bacterium]|jgi:tyrosyl-tRNA synthetase|nr:tyrosine--tRNA ligase [Clostridiales bacterium]